MSDHRGVEELIAFAENNLNERFGVKKASVILDENQEGDPVSRVTLLMPNPDGETWDLDEMRALRQALRRAATELALPWVTLTLIAESEPEAADVFAQ